MNENVKTIIWALVGMGVVIGGIILLTLISDKQTDREVTIRPITSEDHILGDINAPIKIVEYSDLECPFCKRFHSTMKQVVELYNGQVAWVYRHFPLTQVHRNALPLAEASECVAEIGGDSAFWSFLDGIIARAPGDAQFDMSLLGETALEVGVPEEALNACLDDNRHFSSVQDDRREALDTGGSGTPYNLLIVGDQITPVPGAQPFESLKEIIDEALQEQGSLTTQ